MNLKILVLMALIAAVILFSFSVVNAGSFEKSEVNINGVKFNTDGFEEFTGYFDAGGDVFDNVGLNTQSKAFIKKGVDGGEDTPDITILVAENPNGDVTLDKLLLLKGNIHEVKNSTYGGKQGMELTNKIESFDTTFGYVEDGKLVVIHGDRDYFDEVIV